MQDWMMMSTACARRAPNHQLAGPLQQKEKAELTSLEASGMNLLDAIAIAEQYGIGSAVSAGLEERNGKLIFVVLVATDDALNEVMVEVVRPRRVKERTSRRRTGQQFDREGPPPSAIE
jgi:hypothetical protein